MTTIHEPLSKTQAIQLIEHTSEVPYKVLFQLIFSTALNTQEAINLKVFSDNPDDAHKAITISPTRGPRNIVLPQETFKLLNEFRATHGAPDRYFPENMVTRDGAIEAFNTAAKMIGLSESFSLASLRVAAINSFVQDGMSSDSIVKLLGFTSLLMTPHYLSKSNQRHNLEN
ncbi:tyrosine-type recombinase/integrase [Shewanella sp. FJAT-51649]|uniref:tyrosine-type recombinase/integrase n=1 Tax=Shewanella sp. FJAT-51649 TaxID=2864210 RepID=UPI001C654E11|nr:tyrosine-type recombinase/integrase [Shewanella sp. FJAT-51649]QYJ71351.1 tyrosine-type recombinase/integrase [Shewanella sp. FJAT-51649]